MTVKYYKAISKTMCVVLFFLLIFSVGITAKAEGKFQEKVFLGGMPIGLELKTEGLIVVGISDVVTSEGLKRPLDGKDVAISDIVTKVNGKKINTVTEFSSVLKENNGEVILELLRGENVIIVRSKCLLDSATNSYKLGLLVKDSIQGVGTVSYIKEDLSFVTLGHPVVSAPSKKPIKISGGLAYNCMIMGVVKGEKGAAGELKGIFIKDKTMNGTLCENTNLGVYGKFDKVPTNRLYPNKVEIAKRFEAKMGKATILSTVDGEMKEYKIEIVSTMYQPSKSPKGMVIKIVDKDLIETTGGIVQGMSGSPILQNGKLIGVVTHVFINDPLRGYAVYAEWLN